MPAARSYTRRSPTETIRLHLREMWSSYFMMGAETNDGRVNSLVNAGRKIGVNLAREYRTDYPAKGMSGVMITRVPDDFKMPASVASRWDLSGGL